MPAIPSVDEDDGPISMAGIGAALKASAANRPRQDTGSSLDNEDDWED